MPTKRYHIGDVAELVITITRTSTGQVVAADQTITVLAPDATQTTVEATAQDDSTYLVEIPCTQAGVYKIKDSATGDVAATEYHRFTVDPDEFTTT